MKAKALGWSSLLGFSTITLLSACAPDAWNSIHATGFNGFLNQVQAECYYDPISSTNVGTLLEPSGNMNVTYFLDTTSRLYYGKITPAQWTNMITSQLQANPTDRGVECVLNEYQKVKNAEKQAQGPAK